MKLTTTLLVAGLILAGGVALAGKATDPDAKARQDVMDANGGAMKTLGGMAGGDVAFDAAAAQAALKTLADDGATGIPAAFKAQGADDPESKAKAEIWTNWDDFLKKAKALGDAAAATDGTTLDGLKAGMGAIGGACKDCHMTYKAS
jgi:cytochrome c556